MGKRKKNISIPAKKRLKELSTSVEVDELSEFVIRHLEIAKPIIELMKQGFSDEEIKRDLRRTVSAETAVRYLGAAKQVLKSEHSKKRKLVIATHLRRYDRDITGLRNYEPQTDSYSQYIEKKTNAYWKMMDTMHQKEKLLGMHSKSFKIAINNTTNVNVKEVKNNFDLKNLSIEEKIEFLNLIDKCKTGNIIISDEQGEKKVIEKPQAIIEDIEYEEVPNIQYIKTVEEKREEEKPVSTLISIEDKIKKRLLEKAENEKNKKTK